MADQARTETSSLAVQWPPPSSAGVRKEEVYETQYREQHRVEGTRARRETDSQSHICSVQTVHAT